ncbi:hypothetical protein DXG01_010862 [Tephrocybe rancida]|nr:hypothetical protein DXG01_010862 [Tephrocybe rancida]
MSEENDITTHGTEGLGATATLRFSGTGIAVYGTIPNSTVSRVSAYTLDGSSPVTVTRSNRGDTPLYQQLFYQSPRLKDGNHTLIVTAVSGASTFYLDYFRINSTSSQETNAFPSSSLSIFPASASGAPTTLPQATSASSGGHAGAIAGGVIGALVFIALAVAAFLWYRRRRAMRAPSRQAPLAPDPSKALLRLLSTS